MAAAFDPYHAWLGIPKGSRPVNHYQLLGLAPFVSEPPIINEAAEERIELVSKYLAGEHAADARRLLDELAAAKALLLQPASRKAYDAELRKQLGLPPAAEPAAKAPATPAPTPAAPTPAAPAAAASAVPPAASPLAAPAAPAAAAAAPVMAAPLVAAPVLGAPPAAAPLVAAPVMAAPMMAAPIMAPGQPLMAAPAMAAPLMSPPGMAPVMAAPVQPLGMGAGPYGQPDAAFGGAPAVRTAFRRRRTSSSQAALMVMGGAALLVVVVLVFALYKSLDEQAPQVAQRGEPPGATSTGATFPQYRPAPGTSNPWAGANAPASTTRKPPRQDDTVKKEVSGGIGAAMAAESPVSPERRPERPGMRPDPPMVPQPAPEPPKPQPTPEPARPATPQPPKPPMVVEPTKADAKEAAAVMRNLAAVRTALGERNLAKAEEQLDLATLEATATDMTEAIARSRQLYQGVQQFWNAVAEAVKELKATEEFSIDGKPVIVVEASADKLAVRSEGRTLNYQISRIPTSIAYFLAERWLKKDDPASSFVLGAFQAVDPKGSKDLARSLWQQAQGGGIDTSGLLADLEARQ